MGKRSSFWIFISQIFSEMKLWILYFISVVQGYIGQWSELKPIDVYQMRDPDHPHVRYVKRHTTEFTRHGGSNSIYYKRSVERKNPLSSVVADLRRLYSNWLQPLGKSD